MSRALLITLVILALVFGLIMFAGLWYMGRYNAIVSLNEDVTSQWAQVENNTQRRMDLIPNLVATVKGVANFEKETYTAVAEARANAGKIKLSSDLLNDPQAFKQFEAAQGELSSALSRLLVTVERYPELKANENFRDLQVQLEGTENRIAVARKRFNESVQRYNTTIKRFPDRLVASLSGFTPRPYFAAQAGAEQAPKVEF